MADSYVQVNTDGSGKKVDTSNLTHDDGTVVERERVSIADGKVSSALADVDDETPGAAEFGLNVRTVGRVNVTGDDLSAILSELRIISYLLAAGLNINDNLDNLRNDPSF